MPTRLPADSDQNSKGLQRGLRQTLQTKLTVPQSILAN